MYKIYFKQAWQMLKEDKVISIISIFGTALAITMIMVVILQQEIKTVNIAPEVNRERTLYIKWVKEEKKKSNSMNLNQVMGKFYKQYLLDLKVPEVQSIQRRSTKYVSVPNSDTNAKADLMATDNAFWSIYKFSFVEGKPFSSADFQSGYPNAVVTQSVAQALFKGEPPLGKEFIYKERNYRVCGVVKDVSTICDNAYAQIWIPYTAAHEKLEDVDGLMVTILAKSAGDFQRVKEEVRTREISNNPEKENVKVSFIGPYSRKEMLVKKGNLNDDPDMTNDSLRYYLIIAILLLIPAINLSGFSLFKIISRTSEIGVRKAFGATRRMVLTQVLYENMLTSLIGGVIGLVMSYVVAILLKDRLFTFDRWSQFVGDNPLPLSALVSPWIFLYVFLICLALNLLSSGMPAWKASRLNIADSIKQ